MKKFEDLVGELLKGLNENRRNKDEEAMIHLYTPEELKAFFGFTEEDIHELFDSDELPPGMTLIKHRPES